MRPPLNDTWLRIVGITLLTALAVGSDPVYRQPISGLLIVELLFDLNAVSLTWNLNRTLILYFWSRWPRRGKRVRWVLLMLGCCTLATALLFWGLGALRYAGLHGTLAGNLDQIQAISFTVNQWTVRLNTLGLDWLNAFMNAVFYVVLYTIVFTIRDSSIYRQKLAQVEQEKEQLRVANLQSQLDVLKQQVNPHFLFNALNSLSSLISEDPVQAERFVDKLSEVYRYVLRANEQHITTLEAELQFIDAYYHLLKTRYGAGLNLTVAVADAHRGYQLPSLTLQLLVENAVKHNIVSPKAPLAIQIAVTGQGELVVSNTLQKKQSRVLSNGVGLTNIVAKYQMLNLPTPSVIENGQLFTVTLPLLLRD